MFKELDCINIYDIRLVGVKQKEYYNISIMIFYSYNLTGKVLALSVMPTLMMLIPH